MSIFAGGFTFARRGGASAFGGSGTRVGGALACCALTAVTRKIISAKNTAIRFMDCPFVSSGVRINSVHDSLAPPSKERATDTIGVPQPKIAAWRLRTQQRANDLRDEEAKTDLCQSV
jgi:hypothetical protein